MAKAKCYNCRTITDEESLNEPSDLWERVEPGEEMPAGECPKCGALAYLVESEKDEDEVK